VTPGRVLGLVVAAVMVVAGVALAAAGMGWTGDGESTSWAVVGALLAGFGVALPISIVQRARQDAQASELQRQRYGGKR
jgi:type VI protein secretion system component VasK